MDGCKGVLVCKDVSQQKTTRHGKKQRTALLELWRCAQVQQESLDSKTARRHCDFRGTQKPPVVWVNVSSFFVPTDPIFAEQEKRQTS